MISTFESKNLISMVHLGSLSFGRLFLTKKDSEVKLKIQPWIQAGWPKVWYIIFDNKRDYPRFLTELKA
jgi:hypothetical protein